jgi:hypothetical protein
MADYVGPWGRSYYAPVAYAERDPQEELEYLRGMLGDMEREMNALQKQIKELEAKDEK